MRTTQPVATTRMAIAAKGDESTASFSMPLVLLALVDLMMATRRSRNLRLTLLVVTVLMATLLITAFLALGLLPGDALILLLYLPFDDDTFFRI